MKEVPKTLQRYNRMLYWYKRRGKKFLDLKRDFYKRMLMEELKLVDLAYYKILNDSKQSLTVKTISSSQL